MKTLRGVIPATLTAEEPLFVSGVLAAGVHVRSGTTLFVRGAIAGSCTISLGGELLVHGWLSGFVDGNAGRIVVAGEIDTPLELIPGLVAVTAGSTVSVGGRRREVTSTGELTDAQPIGQAEVSGTIVLVREADQTFVREPLWQSIRQLAEIVAHDTRT